uniref:Uncharacterized protein n=1 Tax=Esox lucius TaxID=8010 RepID=A0A6Q2YDB4_ESOLU
MEKHNDANKRFSKLAQQEMGLVQRVLVPSTNVRGQWSSKLEFLLAVAGQIIGLGNIWRFPYLCYKNGGATCLEFDRTVGGNLNRTVVGNITSPEKEFWERRVLNLTDSVSNLGNVRWELALCLLLSWIICYFCVWKGVKSTGKVVYFTATFPYVMLGVLLVRGLTLPGAIDGIKFYLYPDPARLADPQVWMDAGTQIFYSYAICIGCLIALGSYNKYDNNCYKDCMYLCLLNSGTSFIAGFAIFSVLGFMAYEQGTDISTVADSGPGLAFIAYPRAVAMMPVPQFWAICFFIMIILLGLDSEFVGLEALMTAISDMYPSFFLVGHRRKLLLLLISVGCFFIGLVMVTEGGLYIFQLFDYYTCSGMTLLLFATLQSVCISWVYGADRMYENIEDMIGYQPLPLIKYCLKYVTPVICTATFIFSLVKFTPLKFNNKVEYPWWCYVIGWWFTLSSTLMVPLWMIYIVSVTPGTLRQRLSILTTPSDKLPMSKAQKKELQARQSDQDKSMEEMEMPTSDNKHRDTGPL